MSQVVERVTKLAFPLAENLGLELVDVEFVKEGGRMILRVFIDREGGVTIDDCEALSRTLDVELDTVDPIEQAYYLEVSSPGIERPLKKDTDFVRFAGKTAEIRLYSPIEGRKKYKGILRGLENHDIILEDEQAKLIRIPLDQVAKANLAFI
ncbi:MAG: ribosome maturation factor RimP [Bacillota bacterium]|nr:ribosome maturation factor RimP [Bacillota bacterium]MDW7682537.1 ribosome maturation factor RimP [Bacillota bacterium]